MHSIRILLVDDEARFRELLRDELIREGRDVVAAATGAEALGILGKADYDIVLLDMKLGCEDGLDVLQSIRALDPSPEVIMLTAHGTIDTAIEAMRRGAHDFLTKPCNMAELDVALCRAYDHRQLTRQNRTLRKLIGWEGAETAPDVLVGSSSAMSALKATALRAAPSDAPILIQGPSGTGKELLATMIHQASERAAMPFIPVNCGALHEQLLASELFGHERGAFTGAASRKHGLFEVADGGTLFLDEVGEMAPPVQVSLLRVLESGEVRRLGSNTSKQVDVRIISATNRSLSEAVQDGDFREDLFFRLNTIELHIPPLCERTEDIRELVEHFLKHAPRMHHIRELAPPVWDVFMRYAWPGNVRELRNVLERAMVLCPGPTLTTEDLPNLRGLGGRNVDAPATDITMSLGDLERQHIERVLRHFGGNKTQAAKSLGITPKTLYNKLQTYRSADVPANTRKATQ